MAAELPGYFFRTRENGAFVFKVEQETRLRRIEMDQIAVVNIRNGEIKPHGDRVLDDEDVAAIRDWMEARRAVIAERVIDDIRRTVDHLNQVSHWIQSKASDDEVDAVTDDLLLSMHDLRQVLVRRRAERIQKSG
ncbi:hypothetical protein PARPLA_01401 [Rhodobacteraceae bacterium THAF1]|uniref:hypothetical protein n=1 Tax=Palleronia sp. THAF1 TaxID=2587842 RepID=UPI000F413A04|nr:hypothetical protein [Palleronia sp. THAF1]QFU09417.1 hypothetical protein FIU81_12095 [Palleronia sp. THAF1]VDC21952.1 hypothetical protein PARPLA_01401 [Rhodobacteraceae bacterium THAF1]